MWWGGGIPRPDTSSMPEFLLPLLVEFRLAKRGFVCRCVYWVPKEGQVLYPKEDPSKGLHTFGNVSLQVRQKRLKVSPKEDSIIEIGRICT